MERRIAGEKVWNCAVLVKRNTTAHEKGRFAFCLRLIGSAG